MFPFKILEEKYRSVPDNVREAISSTEVNRKLQDIVNKYKLQFDEGEELTKEIGYVMLGLKKPNDFLKNVQKATDLNKETAKKIVEDVNNIILKDIKHSLRENSPENKINLEDVDNIKPEKEQIIRDELLQEIEKPKEKKIEIASSENNLGEKTTDLIKQTERSLQTVAQPTKSTTPNKQEIKSADKDETFLKKANQEEIKKTEQSEQIKNIDIKPENLSKTEEVTKQDLEKKYIIDPYREPLE